MILSDWTVDYLDGNGEHPVTLPHAWRQEAPVELEGPVWYRRRIDVPRSGAWLLFHAVSYRARLVVDGFELGWHEGMWDSFSVSLDRFKGKSITLEVEVTKPGGERFPAGEVAGGFLPYLHHHFGGIWGEVEQFDGAGDPLAFMPGPATPRVSVVDRRIFLDGRPFFMRGLLHQGWYPKLGHCRPADEAIYSELRAAMALGFNTVKFGLWVPPHRYLEIMEELGLVAWIQLPMVRPSLSMNWDRLGDEFERIVRQYRHHANIVAWSLGSAEGTEANGFSPIEFQRRMTRLIRSLTGCPLVGDGGSEGYDHDPRDFGTFSDYPVPGSLPLYQPLLGLLGPASVRSQPTILGEFAEVQAHRDLARLLEDHPYWASALPEFNARGVRLDSGLAGVLRTSRYAHEPRASGHDQLLSDSSSMATFVRRRAIEDARSMPGLSGYVISAWRDTPIASSGVFDDWGEARLAAGDMMSCNGPTALFLLPSPVPIRRGGQIWMTFRDRGNVWCGPNLWRIGVHSELDLLTGGLWRLLFNGSVVAEGNIEQRQVSALQATEVGEAFTTISQPGTYELRAEFGGVSAAWSVYAVSKEAVAGSPVVVASPNFVTDALRGEAAKFGITLTDTPPDTGSYVHLLRDSGDISGLKLIDAPFWEQSAYEFDPILQFSQSWGLLKPIHSSLAIELDSLPSGTEVLMQRVNTRTYSDSGIIVRLPSGSIATTLRPWGGLDGQTIGLNNNPAGIQLLRSLFSIL